MHLRPERDTAKTVITCSPKNPCNDLGQLNDYLLMQTPHQFVIGAQHGSPSLLAIHTHRLNTKITESCSPSYSAN
ncbi:hypothetical protein BN2475_410014 [Paraburkholderia ribeironis]|uniref:Uncharacterized protein n=1 Tax=Paraburkholderia ribeironis TaxID=1247936 RepID=A0A1N7S736_9BURK|nr:hypothetical protein BN2475_410014 [Paraburkholderia ribeironis]